MALGIPVGLLVARVGRIPLTYPVAPPHKLPLLLPLYLLAPAAVEGHRRLTTSHWSDYGIAWNRPFWVIAITGFAVALGGVVLLTLFQVGLGWRKWQFPGGKTPQATPPRPGGDGTQLIADPTNRQEAPNSSPWVVLCAVLPLALFVGWIEELVFRGVLVNGLGQALPIGAMVIAVSLIFAVSHLVWDGPAGAPQLPGLTIMGAVLLLARWVGDGSLGLAWGLHAGWVFSIAIIDALALIGPGAGGPVWLVGLVDQPLTGLLPLGLLLLTGLGVWVFG